jgi:hypothetical protein
MQIMRKVGRPLQPMIRSRRIIGNNEREFAAGYLIEEPHGAENRRNQEAPTPSGLNRRFNETIGMPAGTSLHRLRAIGRTETVVGTCLASSFQCGFQI